MKCNECCGDGYNLRIIKKGNGYTTERVICEHCNGTGEVQTTEPKLKPCPFCGCTSISMFEHIDYEGAFYVMCESCGATLGTALDNMALTEEEITELWNTRVVEE